MHLLTFTQYIQQVAFIKGCVSMLDIAVLNVNQFSFNSQWWEYSPSASTLFVPRIL